MSEHILSLTPNKGRALTLFASLLTGMVLLFGLGIRTAEPQTTPAPATPYYYEVQDLGTLPGGSYSYSYDINDSGHVVGCADTESGQEHAFLYKDGEMKDLGTLGGNNSCAHGINNLGQIVGYSENATSGETHAFLYDSTNGMKDLGTLGGTNSYAYGINNYGQVVGTSDASDLYNGNPHPFLYDSTNGMKDLSVPESPWLGHWPWGSYSYAYDINDSGQVVGDTNKPATYSPHAFLYDIGTKTLKDLGVLGDSTGRSEAYGINASGQVVGWSYDSSGTPFHAFLYSDGTMKDLGSLGTQDYDENWANDINDSGQIVGHSYSGGMSDAFLYQNGQMIDLGTRLLPEDRDGWYLGGGTSINNDGQIVVDGYQDTSAEGGGWTGHALLLTPTTTVPTAPTTPSSPVLDQESDTGASKTDNITNDDTPTFTGTANEGSTVKIYVDGVENGSGTATGGNYNVTATTALDPGDHSITAKASYGSAESSESQALNITVDTTAPDTTISDGPSGTANSTTATFAFSSPESGATFECRLDGTENDYAGCSSPKKYTGLAQGSHTFYVRAKDAAGNADDTPASQRWTIDATAPKVDSFTPSPDGVTGVSLSTTPITATFSEDMNSDTLNDTDTQTGNDKSFTLTKQGTTITTIPVTVSYDAPTKKATLKPLSALDRNAKYTATVKGGANGAKDKAGNALASDKVWSFTTVKR